MIIVQSAFRAMSASGIPLPESSEGPHFAHRTSHVHPRMLIRIKRWQSSGREATCSFLMLVEDGTVFMVGRYRSEGQTCRVRHTQSSNTFQLAKQTVPLNRLRA